MEQRIIKLQIANEYIVGAGVPVGAVGSHDDVLLEMDFRSSALWAGTTRRAIFADALGVPVTPIILTTNLLEEGQSDVYLVPVPAEAKTAAGECFLTVEGYIGEGESEIVRVVTEEATFRVLPSRLYTGESTLTPDAAEQLQAEIDEIKEDIAAIPASVEEAAGSATEAAQSANAAAGNSQDAEAWANGTRNGVAVGEEDAAYQKHSRWWNALAEAAKVAAQTAAQSARNTLASLVETANAKIAAAAAEVTKAKSWAVGGTGVRQGEDTDNAKYWAAQAAAAAGGGVTSFNGRTGSVLPARGDYTADMVGTYSAEQIDTLLQGFAAKETVFNADGSITETGADGSTKVTAFGDGVITETYTAGGVTATKTTTFNADGSITESVA